MKLATLLSIVAIFCMQAWYVAYPCTDSPLAVFIVTAVLLLPAFVSLASQKHAAAFGACLGLAPWVLWAKYVECVAPYTGGGAAMAYVAVFLWGFPCSIVFAVIVQKIYVRIESLPAKG